MISSYKTISERSVFELKESKSRFIAVALNVQTAEEGMKLFSKVRREYYDAAHFPFAYRVNPSGDMFRYSDDGEPSGSGGKPIYDAVVKHSLTNTLVVVVRYFGGIKLGVGGLKRAFFEAADQCLASAKVKEIFITVKINLEFGYKYISAIMKLIEDDDVKILENNSGEACQLIVDVRVAVVDDFRKKIITASNGSINII
ncbi:MAG: YigZ family protein [Ignavibacteria bacterium]|nr:YigZ family protein [Ignavibacteria bacterium]